MAIVSIPALKMIYAGIQYPVLYHTVFVITVTYHNIICASAVYPPPPHHSDSDAVCATVSTDREPITTVVDDFYSSSFQHPLEIDSE